jgi:chitinase
VPAASSSAASQYLTVPEASKAASSSAAQQYPAVPEASKAASSSSAAEYPSVPIASQYAKKPVDEEITSTVHLTLTKVAVPAYTAAPYPTSVGGAAPNVPAGSGAAMPTGTGKPAMPSGYAPPEFEGAASRAGVGITMLVAVVGAVLLF